MSSDKPRTVRTRVGDMIGAVERIWEYTKGMDPTTFRSQRMVQDAVVRNFEILGEASNYIPADLQRFYTAAPWRVIGDLRNVAIHDYGDVEPDRIWFTIENRTRELHAAWRRMLAELDAADPPTP